MERSDEELLADAQAGDRDALGALLKRYDRQVRDRVHIERKWRTVLDIDDMMQLTYFEATRDIRSFRSNARAFPKWLERIAKNNLASVIRWLEAQKRRPPGPRIEPPSDADPGSWLAEQVFARDTTLSTKAAHNERNALLLAAIHNLPSDLAAVVRKRLEGKTFEQIAQEMSRTLGAAYGLFEQACKQLRERLPSRSKLLT